MLTFLSTRKKGLNKIKTVVIRTYVWYNWYIRRVISYTLSTNLYKFRYDSLDRIKEIYESLKRDNKEIFLDFRKSDYRYELGVYDEDRNMVLITKVTED